MGYGFSQETVRQMGDVRWPYRDPWNPGAPSVPPKLFLRLPRRRYSGQEVGQSRPGHAAGHEPVAFDHTFVTFQIISTRWPDSIASPSVMPRPSLCAGAGHQSGAQDVYSKLSQT